MSRFLFNFYWRLRWIKGSIHLGFINFVAKSYLLFDCLTSTKLEAAELYRRRFFNYLGGPYGPNLRDCTKHYPVRRK